MKVETLMILLIFSPERIKKNHPFWKELFKAGIKLDHDTVRVKELKKKFNYLKLNWRLYKNIIINFYSYLKLNFPNPIPFPLFFCYDDEITRKEYDEYREGEFDISVESNIKQLNEKGIEYSVFNESIHYIENDNNDYDDNYIAYLYEDNDIINHDRIIIDLADKWLKDILSGESFYERNKIYFSKHEVKYFLTCDWLELDSEFVRLSNKIDLLEYYWKIRIKANELDLNPYLFINKFIKYMNEIKLFNYFKFICINKISIRNIYEIYDFSDYVFSNEFDGNFNTMTWQDLRHFNNEWHGNFYVNNHLHKLNGLKKIWDKKTIMSDYEFIIDNNTWIISEITSAKQLYEEGKEMRNCVFSYLHNCVSGYCAIFSVKANDKRMATLEISINNLKYQIVQAREKMNNPIKDKELRNLILLWSKENNITIIEENILNNDDYVEGLNNNEVIANNNRFFDIFVEHDEYDEYEEHLKINIDIANNDDSLDALEEEFYAQLYGKYIEDNKNIENK